jgi:hypothetical protein
MAAARCIGSTAIVWSSESWHHHHDLVFAMLFSRQYVGMESRNFESMTLNEGKVCPSFGMPKEHPKFALLLTHFACHHVLISPGWRSPMHWEHGMQFRYFPREFKAPKNQVRSNWASHVSISAQRHREQCKPACPYFFFPSHAVAWIWVARVALISDLSCLQAGRQLEWVLRICIECTLIQWTRSNFIARSEAATLAKTLRLFHSISRDRQREKICHACRCSAPWSLWAGIQRSVFPTTSRCWLLDLFHLCHSHGHTNY